MFVFFAKTISDSDHDCKKKNGFSVCSQTLDCVLPAGIKNTEIKLVKEADDF